MIIRKVGIILGVLICMCLVSCSNDNVNKNEVEMNIESGQNTELGSNDESEMEKPESEVSKAYELYSMDLQKTYPDSVSRAVQNYIVNANATMSTGEIPLNKNMVYVIANEFRYDSELKFHWEYMALQYKKCEIMPKGTNYVYAFSLEEYLLNYRINNDYDESTKTFSGVVYFEYRITENSNSDNIVVRANNVTACIEFKVKYSEEEGHYRLVDLKYLSSRNECDKYANCEDVGHDWESMYKCDAECVRCGAVKGACVPSEGPTCNMERYCTVCNKILESALGHTYSEANCEQPATCIRCGYVDPKNNALGHEWQESGDFICIICGKDYCEVYNHSFLNGQCIWCGLTE